MCAVSFIGPKYWSSPRFRYALWVPLLLTALALSYELANTWRYGPCSDDAADYRAWLMSLWLLGIFIVYCFSGYALAVTRRYLPFSMTTLWAWHLLTLSPFLTELCAGGGGNTQSYLRAGLGFCVPEWTAAIALAAAASSLALYRCYRRWNGPAARAILGGMALLTTVLASGMYWLVPALVSVYGEMGAELPSFSQNLVRIHPYWNLLVLPHLAAFVYAVPRVRMPPVPHRVRHGAVILLVFLNVLLGLLTLGIFLPGLKMCACV
ncbi:MAG: hypothetical protein GY862_17055 [Gammaproteobacteria bacterium]|nr:hypothetical protein [Gammaproteobacteria bacterium]